MDWEELKNKGVSELNELLNEKRNELHGLYFQAHGRQLKQVHKISVLKKDIARMQMLLVNAQKKMAVNK